MTSGVNVALTLGEAFPVSSPMVRGPCPKTFFQALLNLKPSFLFILSKGEILGIFPVLIYAKQNRPIEGHVP